MSQPSFNWLISEWYLNALTRTHEKLCTGNRSRRVCACASVNASQHPCAGESHARSRSELLHVRSGDYAKGIHSSTLGVWLESFGVSRIRPKEDEAERTDTGRLWRRLNARERERCRGEWGGRTHSWNWASEWGVQFPSLPRWLVPVGNSRPGRCEQVCQTLIDRN